MKTVPQSLKPALVVFWIHFWICICLGIGTLIAAIAAFDDSVKEGLGRLLGSFLIGPVSAVLTWYAIKGLKRLSKGWWIYAIVTSIVGLISFPIGTILGIIALIALFSSETQEAVS